MKTIFPAGTTLAAIVIGLASVQAATARHPTPAKGLTRVEPPFNQVYWRNGHYRGSDPDPFIRGQIRRDIPMKDRGY